MIRMIFENEYNTYIQPWANATTMVDGPDAGHSPTWTATFIPVAVGLVEVNVDMAPENWASYDLYKVNNP